MFWIALAAQLSAPTPLNLNNWFYAEDTPRYLTDKDNGLWLVGVRLNVSPQGVLQSCEIESTSGIPKLDDFSCRTLVHRAKFKPAQWIDGNPTVGVFRTSVKWAVSDVPLDFSNVSKPDLDLSVQSLPAKVHSPALVYIMFSVGTSGQLANCTAEPDSVSGRVESDPALVEIACEQFSKSYRAIPAKDDKGNLVPSVQDGLVRFTMSKHS